MAENIRIASVEQLGSDPVLRDVALADCPPGQVQVRMRAAALNFADLLKAKGQYQEPQDPPFLAGLEGAGEVMSAPENSGFNPGDRIIVSHPGTMAQVISVPPVACQKIPDCMSFEQAAGFQVAYGTSHLALDGRADLRAGETLVVLGAAGGVGLTAVEIGKAMGARVIAVARGAARLETVRAAGADVMIDSDDCGDLKSALRELGGVDVVYDPVGGAMGEAAFRALKRGGRFLVIGFAGGGAPALPLNHALVKNIAVHGFYWGGYRLLDPGALRSSMSRLLSLFEAGKLHPVAGKVLPLEQLVDGYDLLRTRKSVGKIIITL
ncbi:NADPH:quinone oxidoreductase family protein [Paracoccus sp. Z330]|uniref:NADPH:quinone oxidoreductase family protein n=1 Tax=Paracoccus onchidii TaxID=3017813 RepID=A0ABT4ZGI4_9RHOB|nr:NADPH:quinone oxidoreductase family protein [Paracoccus onchidii]MDB6178073.1 NADPH:quinone oxidoreductase family protein [Paracoccus onchidii]